MAAMTIMIMMVVMMIILLLKLVIMFMNSTILRLSLGMFKSP